MGSPVVVGPLSYNVIEADWRDALEGDSGPRLPKNRWLVVRITVTNGGGADQSVPLLHLLDSKGNSHMEDDKGEGIGQWLGLIRILKPAQTEEGFIAFDVPPAGYQLRVTTGGEPQNEVTSNVEIPFRLDAARPGVSSPPR